MRLAEKEPDAAEPMLQVLRSLVLFCMYMCGDQEPILDAEFQTMKDVLSHHIDNACRFVAFWVLVAMTEHRLMTQLGEEKFEAAKDRIRKVVMGISRDSSSAVLAEG